MILKTPYFIPNPIKGKERQGKKEERKVQRREEKEGGKEGQREGILFCPLCLHVVSALLTWPHSVSQLNPNIHISVSLQWQTLFPVVPKFCNLNTARYMSQDENHHAQQTSGSPGGWHQKGQRVAWSLNSTIIDMKLSGGSSRKDVPPFTLIEKQQLVNMASQRARQGADAWPVVSFSANVDLI